MKLNWRKTFFIGFGFLGISLMWQIYNLFVPLFLQSGNPAFNAQSKSIIPGFGLSASVTGVVMTLDNVAALFILPLIGIWSDRTRTRIGRRYPFILAAAPIAAIAFVLIPMAAGRINLSANGSIAANPGAFAFFLVAIGLMLLAMAFFRTPVIALMPDLTASPLRSKANGVINLMGGLGGIIAALGLARLFDANHILPFAIGSALLIVAVILLFVTVKEPPLPELPAQKERKQGIVQELKAVPAESRRSLFLLMAAIFSWFVGYNAIETFFSSYAVTTLGVSAGAAGTLFSISIGLFILFSIPAGYIGVWLGRRRTITLGLGIFAVLLIIAYLLPNATVLTIVLGLGGMAWALVNINSLPMVIDLSEGARLLGTYTGFYYAASQTAAIFGPVLNGFIIDATGRNYNSIFIVAPIFFLLAALCMSFVTRGEAHS
jgi:maltose/moltooligosaccharide transporter